MDSEGFHPCQTRRRTGDGRRTGQSNGTGPLGGNQMAAMQTGQRPHGCRFAQVQPGTSLP
jgi:hypothetical protein